MIARPSLALLTLLLLRALVPASDAEEATAARAVSVDGSPEVAIDGTKRDFGVVFAGEQLNHVFVVRNLGSKTLELDNKSLTGRLPAPSVQGALRAASFHKEIHIEVGASTLGAGATAAAPT